MPENSTDKKKQDGPGNDTAVFTFGRMNPPTVGHEKLINKTLEHAKKVKGDHFVFVSHSHDPQKNPLSPEDKVHYIRKAVKGANVMASNKSMPSFMAVAKHLSEKGYKKLHMVVGDDRVDDFKKKLQAYNGTHYNFDHINVVSAGARDPDAEGVEGMSGTKMRMAAASGDHEKFKSGLMSGLSNTHRAEIYKKVRAGMSLREGSLVPSFKMFLENVESPDTDIDEDDLDDIADDLEWHDIFDMYDDDEVEGAEKVSDEDLGEKKEVKESVILEGLTPMGRIKRRVNFIRTEKKRAIAAKIVLNRPSTPDRLQNRAKLAARRMLEKIILRGRNKAEMSPQEKSILENRLRSLGNLQIALAQKLMPKVREIEKKRLSK